MQIRERNSVRWVEEEDESAILQMFCKTFMKRLKVLPCTFFGTLGTNNIILSTTV